MADTESIDILADRVDRLACAKCGHHMDLSDVAPFTDVVCPQCGQKQTAPLRLGGFLLLKEMGKGGMGAVYRAFDPTLGRYVAIKVMQRELAEDPKFAQNFIREARAAAALNHPHVVQIYSCSQEKGQLYIVMELVDGGRLDALMEGGKQQDEWFTLEVGQQIARGLEAAAQIGMIHGDIKPGNILFDKNRNAKVVDFGLARFAAQQHLQPGEIWGTPYYIAPEKVRSHKEDERADIYSLGATLFHALSGVPPFEGDTAKDVVVARLQGPAPNLSTLRPSLQPETVAVIARALEADPGRRYPTYKSLLADLDEAIHAARQRHGKPAKAGKSSGSKGLLMVGAMALAAVVLVGLLIWGNQRPAPESELPSFIRPLQEVPAPVLPGEEKPSEEERRIAAAAAAAAAAERQQREDEQRRLRDAERREWETARTEAQRLSPAAALAQVQQLRAATPAWLRQEIDAEVDRLQGIIRAEEEARQAAARAAHAAAVQTDMDQVEALRERLRRELVPSRNFRAATPRVTALMQEMETDQGRAALEGLQDAYTRLEDLRQFIIAGVRSDPFRQGDLPELGGNARGATATGLRVELVELQGDRTWRWAELDVRLLSRLAEHYIQRAPAADQAGGYLSLAVLGYESGVGPAAKLYASRAIHLQGDFAAEVKRLMPTLEL